MNRSFFVQGAFAVLLHLILLVSPVLAVAGGKTCDRSCLRQFADQVLKSMVSHDPGMLPLSASYAATENSQPAELGMMSLWRTVTGIRQAGQYVIDSQAGQIFFTAAVDESSMPAIFLARLKIEGRRISELELYIDRSRADSGFLFQPDAMGRLPDVWTSSIPEGQSATREELLQVGRAIFDTSLPTPEVCSECILMEMGGVVYEDPDYLKAIMADAPKGQSEEVEKPVTIPCGLIPNRPEDPHARVAVVDEVQGIVVSFGVVQGFVSPYLVTHATESCFVPASMIEEHRKYLNSLDPEVFKNRKILREMPSSVAVMEMIRFYSNRIQGMHRYMNLQGPGAVSPWGEAGP